MSDYDYIWCHGPSCHKQHTQDRIRGNKGSKVLRTRKIKQWDSKNMYSYFCSNSCYNEFAHKYIEQVIAIAPRTEPLETSIEVKKVVHPEYHYNSGWTRPAWTETKISEINE